ncbi:MAG: TolC family protein [Kiritimatiellae bacterium]|nr:TolC family protein [Kiritimatiellia bacterium]
MFTKTTVSIVTTICLLAMGCATERSANLLPSAPLGQELPAIHIAAVAANSSQKPELFTIDPGSNLTLQQALALALMHNPELEAYSHEVRAAEARALQAGLPPNPELEFEMESFDRDGEGYNSSEPSLLLSQVIELGGKRKKRTRVAQAQGEVAGWSYQQKRLEVLTATANHFVGVIAAGQRLALARSLLELVGESSRSVSERVNAGKESPVLKTKANAEMEIAQLDVADAESVLVLARTALAALWNSERSEFQIASNSFDKVRETLPALDALRLQLAANPELAEHQAEVRTHQAALEAAQAERIPNLTLAAGVQRYEEDRTHALIFGVGVPLPLFDRNQGNIAAAQHELAKAMAEERSTAIDLSSRLNATYHRLQAAHRRVQALRLKVVPAMEEAYHATHSGYREGKYDLLLVLDAQRTLFAAKRDMVDALADFHTALNDLEQLTGKGV